MKVSKDKIEQFLNAVNKLVSAIKTESERCGEACGGINEKEMIALSYVGLNHTAKMSDIAERLDAPMSTVTSIVDKLVDKKLLTREHSANDRRTINVSLAPNGKSSFKTLVDEKSKTGEKLMSQLSEKEQEAFIKHINLLASYLGQKK